MKLLLVLLAVIAVFIKNSKCNNSKKCKESSFTPCDNLDMKKMIGRWHYLLYEDNSIAVHTCSFSEILYSPCKDKYSIKYHTFNGDAESVKEAWIDIPTADIGILDVTVSSVIQRVYVTEVDYDKYVLVQGCYKNKRKHFKKKNHFQT